MSNPLGIIVDRNPDPRAVDVYAVVLNNIVMNTIVADYNFAVSIQGDYDYLIDVTMHGDNNASTGYTYNAGLNEFLAPPAPPIDYVENVRQEFNNIISILQQMLLDAENLENNDIAAAYNSSLNDNIGLNNPTVSLIESIHQYIVAGG